MGYPNMSDSRLYPFSPFQEKYNSFLKLSNGIYFLHINTIVFFVMSNLYHGNILEIKTTLMLYHYWQEIKLFLSADNRWFFQLVPHDYQMLVGFRKKHQRNQGDSTSLSFINLPNELFFLLLALHNKGN